MITFLSIRSLIPDPHMMSISLMIIIMYHKFQNSHRALLLKVDFNISSKYLIVSYGYKHEYQFINTCKQYKIMAIQNIIIPTHFNNCALNIALEQRIIEMAHVMITK